MPDMDRDRDLFEAKPPASREEREILRCGLRAGHGGTSVGVNVRRSHLRAAHYLNIRTWLLTRSGSDRHLRPPTKQRSVQCKEWIDEIARPACQPCDQPVENHHFVFGSRIRQRTYSTDDGRSSHSIGKKPSTCRGVRPTSRNANHRKPLDVQVVSKAGDIGRPISQPTNP